MGLKKKEKYTHLNCREVDLIIRFYKNGVSITRLSRIFEISFERVVDIINVSGAYQFRIKNFDMESRNKEIRKLRKGGYSLDYISKEYGISKQRISQIIEGPNVDELDIDGELMFEFLNIKNKESEELA